VRSDKEVVSPKPWVTKRSRSAKSVSPGSVQPSTNLIDSDENLVEYSKQKRKLCCAPLGQQTLFVYVNLGISPLLNTASTSTPRNLASTQMHISQTQAPIPIIHAPNPSHNFDLTASRRYLTSLSTLVAGFQSSNCFKSSVVSVSSSVLTKSSSSKPRMIQGRTYGLAFVGTSYFFSSRGTSPTEVVSSAYSTARLLKSVKNWLDWSIGLTHKRFHRHTAENAPLLCINCQREEQTVHE